MVENIYQIKNKLIEQVEKEMRDKGPERIDPDTVDMIKDLAEAEKSCWEAEYYRSVVEAMDFAPSGYHEMPMGYRAYGRGSANQYGGRRGYRMGYDIESLRDAMQDADPQERERMKREIQQLTTQM